MTSRRDFIRKSGTALGAFAALRHIPGLPAGFVPPGGPPLENVPTDDKIKALMADCDRRREICRRELLRRPDRAIPEQLRHHARTADHPGRRHRLDRRRRSCASGRNVGIRGDAQPHDRRSRTQRRAKRSRSPRRTGSRRTGLSILAPTPSVQATWNNGFTKDPWDIPVEEKADLLIKANTEAMKAKNVKFVSQRHVLREGELATSRPPMAR